MTKLHTAILIMVLAWTVTGTCLAGDASSATSSSPIAGSSNTDKSSTSTGLKPAKMGAAASTHVTIAVDQPFTQEMADRANLDPNKPQLSNNGVQSDSDQKLASSECLLAETLVMKTNGFRTDKEVKNFCENASKADSAEKMDSVNAGLEERAGTRIDDVLIHIVSWSNGKADGAWYHYDRHANGWSGKLVPFSRGDAVTSVDHLLGHGNVAFLAIHLGIDDSCDISYDISAQHTTPLNQQDVADLIKLATDYLTNGAAGTNGTSKNGATSKSAPSGPHFAFIFKVPDGTEKIGVWGGQTILQLPALPASITLTPTTGKTVSAKAPGMISDLEDSAFQITTTCATKSAGTDNTPGAGENASSGPVARSGGPWRAKAIHWTPFRGARKPQAQNGNGSAAPGDGKVDSSATKDPLANMGQSVTNEGIYWWDVSVALPVTSYKNLKFDSQNNLIVVKNSNDIKPYALFDFYPGGADLRAKNGISMLGLFAGIPMANRPLQRPFVGGGFTIGIKSFRFQPLVGVRIEKDTRTTTLTPGSPGSGAQLSNDLRSEWHVKLQVMLGFSIGDARKVLGL